MKKSHGKQFYYLYVFCKVLKIKEQYDVISKSSLLPWFDFSTNHNEGHPFEHLNLKWPHF